MLYYICIYIYIYIFHCKRDYRCESLLKAKVATDKENGRNEIRTLSKEMKLE